MNEAAYRLRALGRLTEALQPMRAGLENYERQEDWTNAAALASNLSELELMLGRLPDAVSEARQSITHADQSGDAFLRMVTRTRAADASHQSGQRAAAGTLFAEAEAMQLARQSQFALLYSVQGFQYCDWQLAPAEEAAWRKLLDQPLSPAESALSEGLAEVERRGNWCFDTRQPGDSLLDIALDDLTLARVGLRRAILAGPLPLSALDLPHFPAALNGLRAAGDMTYLPRALLTAALYHFVRGEPDLTHKHLAEAQQLAERGPMPLFLADIHLHRARLFHDPAALAEAARLIRTLGYGRRTAELADAEAALAHIGGDNYGQAGQTLTNSTNMIQQQAPGELDRQVRELIAKLPEERKAETKAIEEDLEMVIKQATSEQPNRKWFEVSSQGLLEATKYVKDFTGNIAGTLGNLGKLVLGGSEAARSS